MAKKLVTERDDLKELKKLIPDTSVTIEGVISKEIEAGNLKPEKILVHEAVVSELENQANKGKEIGLMGLEEIKRLNKLSKEKGFDLEFKGSRPGEFEIKYAKSGEIDSMIREFAGKEQGTLVSADRVQAFVAESKGIDALLYRFERTEKEKLSLEKYFDDKTMSVHLKERCVPTAKRGEPGEWKYVKAGEKELSKEDIEALAKEIMEEAHTDDDSFIEIDRKGSTIAQIRNYRIVITRPPFSDGYEITAVRPVATLSLDDYGLSDKLVQRIGEKAEGILISGAPGHGKSTFAQALAEYYNSQEKVVKTLEAPRDLVLSDNITQYAISHGSSREAHDILLLSRPDYTIFDEMRNTSDFELFSDLRLSGVGMIGVVHATQTIDAVQRFLGRVELGVIPHVIDTVIFIREGEVSKVYALKMEVKVPSGMTEADLARPVVVVHDFETGSLEFEIYTYGEETVVIPVSGEQGVSPAMKLARKQIETEFSKYTTVTGVEVSSPHKATVYVPKGEKGRVVGKGGAKIDKIEKELGIGIDVREGHNQASDIPFQTQISKKGIVISLDQEYANEDLDIYVDGEFLMSARVSKKGQIKLSRNNKLGQVLADGMNSGKKVDIKK